MTHLNFSVEQHGAIYILLSGNVSTFSSSSNIEKIQKGLEHFHNAHTHTHTDEDMLHISWKQMESICTWTTTVQRCSLAFLITEVINIVFL